jgi:hypothetical protein
MLIEEGIKLKGHVKIEKVTPEGVKSTIEVDNLILTDGLEIFVDRLAGLIAQPAVAAIAAGSNNTAPVVGDTDVITPIVTGGDRAVTANTHPTSPVGRFFATFAAGVATGTWRELALADTMAAKGARKCISRVTFADTVKGGLDVISVTWEITFA